MINCFEIKNKRNSNDVSVTISTFSRRCIKMSNSVDHRCNVESLMASSLNT